MTEILATAWERRSSDLPYRTPEEALVLASMIEAETAQESERHRIAAVFVNRLRRGMRLQSDPTVLYGMDPDSSRNISKADLKRPHRWNTYRIRGLPPTPIGIPGRASIDAAMRPATTNDLYFVANGSGGHAFATTLRQHNRNVARWKALRSRPQEASSARRVAGGLAGAGAARICASPRAAGSVSWVGATKQPSAVGARLRLAVLLRACFAVVRSLASPARAFQTAGPDSRGAGT